MDLYFWMIDRAELPDDQRNSVDVINQKVKLYKDHSMALENGFYVSKIMQMLRKALVKKTKKVFTLDPQLNNLRDQPTLTVKHYNWSVIFSELKKFSIQLLKEKREQVLAGRAEAIQEVVHKLFEFDQNMQAFIMAHNLNNNYPGALAPEQLVSASPEALTSLALKKAVFPNLNNGSPANQIADASPAPSGP